MMGYLQEKVSYIRGLADGLGIDAEEKQGRVLLKMLELLEDIVDSVEDNEATVTELNESVESLSEDLAELEDHVYGSDGMDTEIRCPHCGEMVYLDTDSPFDEDGEPICPHCRALLLGDDDDEDEEDDD